MKTKHILFAALIISGFLIFSSFSQQEQGNKYLTIESVETYTGSMMNGYRINSYIIIIDEDGKTEKIDLDPFDPKNPSGYSIKLNELINKTADKGYELKSTTTVETNNFVTIKDFYFIKK